MSQHKIVNIPLYPPTNEELKKYSQPFNVDREYTVIIPHIFNSVYLNVPGHVLKPYLLC